MTDTKKTATCEGCMYYGICERFNWATCYGYKEAPKIHISKGNMKMGRIPSFSLTPVETCSPEACKTCAKQGCYALKSYKMYPSVRKAWGDNTWLAWHNLPSLEKQLEAYFTKKAPRFFRIHVAGDFVSIPYAEMWYRIIKKHPETKFLAFTKQFDIIRNVPFYELGNMSLRLSDWPGIEIPSDLKKLYHVAWMNDGTRDFQIFPCDYLECPGNCETCGACWDLDKDTLFHKH